MRRFPLLLLKSVLLSSSPESAAVGWQAAILQPGCSAPGLCLSQVRTRICVQLPRQGDTVVCITQAQLLVQTLVQVPPPSCRGSPRCPRAARVSPHPEPIAHSQLPEQPSSHPCSAPSLSTLRAHPALLLPLAQGCIPGPGLRPSRSRSQRRAPPAPRGHGAAQLNPAPLFLLSSVTQSLPATAPTARHALRIGRGEERTEGWDCTGAGSG